MISPYHIRPDYCGKIPIVNTTGGILYHRNGIPVGIDAILNSQTKQYHLYGPLEFIDITSPDPSYYIIFKCGPYFVRFQIIYNGTPAVSSLLIIDSLISAQTYPINFDDIYDFNNYPGYDSLYDIHLFESFESAENIAAPFYPIYEIPICMHFDGPEDEHIKQYCGESCFDLECFV